jgi:hypothetical protein
MESKKILYLVTISKDTNPEEDHSVVNTFWDTTAVCGTVKKAYHIGLWMAGIKESSHTYRKTADTVRDEGIVFISEKSNPEEARIIITKVKRY